LVFESVILGIVQGLTEFLPVSSTAHLILFPWFFNWRGEVDTLTFDIALHAGTLLALIVCFWRDWLDIILNKQKLFIGIIFASLPAGIIGFLLNDIAESYFRNPLLISGTLVSVGFVMLMAERAKKVKALEEISFTDALLIGIAQAFAIIPGVSRSGITIATGLFRGIEREAAARFSFLLATPIIAGAGFLHAPKAYAMQNADYQLFAIGLIISFLTGYLAIKFLLKFLKRYPLHVFVYYRFALSAVIIAGIWLKG
jgi:undecaprenyl-diphosphatase